MDLPKRFIDKVELSDCWLWIGTTTLEGYGKYSVEKKTVLAHRFAYELLRGKIPKGLTLDHLCRNRNCVNPNHLEPVTQKENVLRGVGITAINARKTLCKHGHKLDRVVFFKNQGKNGRACSECSRINQRRYSKKHPDLIKSSNAKYRLKQQLRRTWLGKEQE